MATSQPTQPFQPIGRRKVYELIAEQLTAEIGRRALQPGDVLPPERELTLLYRAGRSSVREALRMLESRGLIRPVGNGSFVVADFFHLLNHSFRLLLSLDQATMNGLYSDPRALACGALAPAADRRPGPRSATMA